MKIIKGYLLDSKQVPLYMLSVGRETTRRQQGKNTMTPQDIKDLANRANRAIYIVDRGSLAQQDDLEDEQGEPISAILDGLWAEAEDAGMQALVRKIKRAYNKQVHG